MNEPLPESLSPSSEEEAKRMVEYEATLDDARAGTPPSAELHRMRDVLMQRLSALQVEMDHCCDCTERELLRSRAIELDEQIRVLDEEARINQFVEETIKFSHEVRRLSEG